MLLDTTLLYSKYYKVGIEGKVEQSKERSSALHLHLGVGANEKGVFRLTLTMVANFSYFYI